MVFVWVALYGLTYIFADRISQAAGLTDWTVALAMMLYVSALILWIYRTGQIHEVRLCVPQRWRLIEYLPLLVLPIFNLLTVKNSRIDLPAAVLMLSVSTAEEIFFRGFLLRHLTRRSKLSGILITGAVFAMFHCVNLIQSAEASYTLMQVLCAFAVGVCYCAIVIQGNSLFPCIIAHGLTNITGSGDPLDMGDGQIMLGLWTCIAVYACYGIWLCRRICRREKEISL